jgi:antirestriction protein
MSCRIYAASLSDYNAGILHGAWVDVSDAATMWDEISAMLAESPTAKEEGLRAEEFAIHDYEGFGELHLSEYEGLDAICAIAEGVAEHGDAFLSWAASETSRQDDVDGFEDAFNGEWDCLADYVQDYWEQSGDMPEAPRNAWWHPANYIDWERMAHDLEISGDVWTAPAGHGKVWVFSNR